MGFEPELFEISDETLAAGAMRGTGGYGYPQGAAFDDISLDDIKAGPVRMNLPKNWAPFAEGNFPTPSGKCELYSEREGRAGATHSPTTRRLTKIRRPGPNWPRSIRSR
jgi:hypothetical protein